MCACFDILLVITRNLIIIFNLNEYILIFFRRLSLSRLPDTYTRRFNPPHIIVGEVPVCCIASPFMSTRNLSKMKFTLRSSFYVFQSRTTNSNKN